MISADIQGPLSINLPKLPIQKSEEFDLKSVTVTITYIQKEELMSFSPSLDVLVKMALQS